MVQPAVKYYTQEEYLAFERQALEKHEYYKGEIFNMAGASINHNKLLMNFIGETRNFLKGKSCDVFGSDLRIHIPSNTLYTYPDAVIVCNDLETLDNEADTILNPVVIIEILSPSTQSYDRGDKFMLYRSIQSLQEYILIDSLSVKVEHYTRQPNGTWLLQEWKSLPDNLFISSINFTFPLSELYSGVKL